jgi:ergothioneine biosynthesis protein EgtB
MISTRQHIHPREPLVARLAEARRLSDDLFGLLRPGALAERPIPERHRLVFYLGHLEAFDSNLLAGEATSSPAGELNRLFSFGIDPVDGRLPDEPASAWPSESEVRVYGGRSRAAVDHRLQEPSGAGPERQEDLRLLHTAIEHRLMHLETLAYALHRLPFELKLPQPSSALPEARRPDAPDIRVPAGRATLGAPRDGRFGWDNEFEAHACDVPAFTLAALKVTHGEFLDFVNDGGYERAALWDAADWEWLRRSGLRHPAFWRPDGSRWRFRGMFEERALPEDEPVWVSHAEAEAYARWKGMRLPTEAEWHRAAFAAPDGGERDYPWGSESPAPGHGNVGLLRWDPTPVGAFPDGRSAFGGYDMLGNGWEWTSTIFAPFVGFASYDRYPGYSADFFDGRHFVLKGGSPRTHACLLRRSFRNWFQPHYPYVYAGFRLVKP